MFPMVACKNRGVPYNTAWCPIVTCEQAKPLHLICHLTCWHSTCERVYREIHTYLPDSLPSWASLQHISSGLPNPVSAGILAFQAEKVLPVQVCFFLKLQARKSPHICLALCHSMRITNMPHLIGNTVMKKHSNLNVSVSMNDDSKRFYMRGSLTCTVLHRQHMSYCTGRFLPKLECQQVFL